MRDAEESVYTKWRRGEEEVLGSEPVSVEMEEEGTTVRVVARVQPRKLAYLDAVYI